MLVEPELLAVLACPKDHAQLDCSTADQTLTCPRCQTVYPIRDGIPILIIEG